jgi:hypothetical protein
MTSPAKLYVGVFGGGGSSNDFNATQFGTAYLIEADGGPLAVNAFGQLNGQSGSFYGAQVGYKAPEIFLNSSSEWSFGPAGELEGFYMNSSSFNGTLINNTARVPEHDFQVTYPMSRSVFLLNGVLNFNNPRWVVHPYIGLGIGGAIARISGATAMQTNPPEPGVNHYNTNSNATDTAFAGQIKLGLNYDINKYVNIFADYRWLYLSSTQYTFGSTVVTAPVPHVETSSWQVKLDPQRYNLGDIGVRVNI